MEFFRKVKQKIDDGLLQDFLKEGRWLWKYVRRYRAVVLIHILLGVAAIGMGLATSVASKFLIDAVTGYQSGAIASAAAFMVGMLIGNIVLKSVASRIGAVINIRVQNEIQAEVYHHILGTDWESVEQFRSGDLLQRLVGDVGTVCGGVTGFMPGAIGAAVQFLGALGIMLYFDPTMALIAVLGIPAAAVSSRFLVGRMRSHNRKMKELSGDMMSFYEDSLDNLTSIKAFDITSGFFGKMLDLQHRYRDEYLDYNLFSVKTSAFLSVVGLVVSGGCFGWGVFRLWSGAISFGSMMMFLQLAGTLSGAFSTLIGLVSSAISISTSAGRVMDVTELPAEDVEGTADFSAEKDLTLTIEDVSFSYQKGETVLENVNFSAGAGEIVALTGPSGEGKTTMLRLFLGLIRPQKGRAVLEYHGKETPLSAASRSAFAYVPQGNSLMMGTIEENLRLTKPEAEEEELWQVLELTCAAEFVRQLPGGLAYTVGGRGKGLSEGQGQRIAVARALLKGAPILLLDEATSALDEGTEERMLRNLMNSGRVHTCIFVTHRRSMLHICSRQYDLEDGTCVLKQGEETEWKK